MDSTDTTRAGTLTVTVWPDTPLGEHQRYAYRIEDTATGQSLQGRDLFTGTGEPADPGMALRELAAYLTAADPDHVSSDSALTRAHLSDR